MSIDQAYLFTPDRSLICYGSVVPATVPTTITVQLGPWIPDLAAAKSAAMQRIRNWVDQDRQAGGRVVPCTTYSIYAGLDAGTAELISV